MTSVNRRTFLKRSGMALTPAVLPAIPALAQSSRSPKLPDEIPAVSFFSDGAFFDGPDYWAQLELANKKQPISIDRYGRGGVVDELQQRFAAITGKEKAIYMPSGTMANQLAIAVLSGDRTKVFVQDTSHVYRDEADAAQSVFDKRLMPLATDKTFFTVDELKKAVDNLPNQEVFSSGIGCVSIENPVRRSDGRLVPLEEIKKISAYCRSNKIPLHLDGARIYMTAAWSGVPVKEWASYFDTIYISLYKYLGASGGAMLCGESSVIDKMPHLVKIHGGNMFGNWLNAAMALHRLDGLEDRLQEAIRRSRIIFSDLDRLSITVTALDGGTNIYSASFPNGIDVARVRKALADRGIHMRGPQENNKVLLTINETLLYREPKYISDAFAAALSTAS